MSDDPAGAPSGRMASPLPQTSWQKHGARADCSTWAQEVAASSMLRACARSAESWLNSCEMSVSKRNEWAMATAPECIWIVWLNIILPDLPFFDKAKMVSEG